MMRIDIPFPRMIDFSINPTEQEKKVDWFTWEAVAKISVLMVVAALCWGLGRDL